MTDKIRIVGEFGDGVVAQVEEFVSGLQGVAHVEVLRNGVELYANGDKGEGVPVTEILGSAEASSKPKPRSRSSAKQGAK